MPCRAAFCCIFSLPDTMERYLQFQYLDDSFYLYSLHCLQQFETSLLLLILTTIEEKGLHRIVHCFIHYRLT